MNEIKNRKLLIGWSAAFLTRLDDMGPFLFRGRSFFQPGTRLEHFLRGLKIFEENLRGLKKMSKNLRGLKLFSTPAFKGSEILYKIIIRGVKFSISF